LYIPGKLISKTHRKTEKNLKNLMQLTNGLDQSFISKPRVEDKLERNEYIAV
jgi:hypothetical protein